MASETASEWITVPASNDISPGNSNSNNDGNSVTTTVTSNGCTATSDSGIGGVKSNLNPSAGSPPTRRLFEPSRDSYFSKNLLGDDADSEDELLNTRLAAAPGFHKRRVIREENSDDDGDYRAPRQVKFSEKSRSVIEEANRLLESIEASRPRQIDKYRITDDKIGARNRHLSEEPGSSDETMRSTSLAKCASGYIAPSTTADSIGQILRPAPRFPRIDFDDMLEEELADRKPAWQQLQESIKTSYRKPKRSVERHRELNEMQDATLSYAAARRNARRRSKSPFSMHLDGESFLPRAPSWMANEAIQPRGLEGTGPYCAPAVSSTAGLEADSQPSRPFSRYERLVDDIEARLLKTSVLPAHMKTVTRHEFRRAPQASSGSAAESLAMDEELGIPLPRPYYSRPDRSDPNYFDFDLQHSIDLYRKPDGAYIPRGPQPWENKVLREAMSKGDAPVSGYMFTRGEPLASTSGTATTGTSADASTAPSLRSAHTDWRTTGTSYLSAALRTASFWEHRFASIGAQVRDSNPVSMDSILRNKPTPNRFTEYRDPDFEDYEDPREAE